MEVCGALWGGDEGDRAATACDEIVGMTPMGVLAPDWAAGGEGQSIPSKVQRAEFSTPAIEGFSKSNLGSTYYESLREVEYVLLLASGCRLDVTCELEGWRGDFPFQDGKFNVHERAATCPRLSWNHGRHNKNCSKHMILCTCTIVAILQHMYQNRAVQVHVPKSPILGSCT